MVSRMGGSILTSLNLSEWIAKDIPSYEDLVLTLSQDAQKLTLIKQDLSSRILNTHQQPKRLTHSLEQGLLAIIEKQRFHLRRSSDEH
jgi:predicted O-linked N-acetylglucosamine transferase (SPINDLY family)